jgi:Na+/H+ antiporter NhaD/arsenite permease-like protein
MFAVAVAIFVGVYILIATEKIPKAVSAVVGAILMLIVGVVSYSEFWHLIDFKTIAIIFGVSVLIEVAKKSDIFTFIAIKAIKRTEGDPHQIFVLFLVLTYAFSSILNNVSTMIVMATLTIVICKSLKLDPKPFLIGEAVVSNVGGLVFAISSIPNILVVSASGMGFVQYFIIAFPLSAILLLVTILIFKRFFPPTYIEEGSVVERLDEWSVVKDRKLFWRSGIVLVFTVALFFVSDYLPITLDIIAVSGAMGILILTSHSTRDAFREVDWETLIFFAGLFIMVGGLEGVGFFSVVGDGIRSFSGGDQLAESSILFLISSTTSAVVDNIPMAAALIPVVSGLSTSLFLWFVLVFSLNLGGSLTPVGSPSNVVAIGIAKNEGIDISFGEYVKKGGAVAVVQLIVAFLYVITVVPFLI